MNLRWRRGSQEKLEGEGRGRNDVNTVLIYEILKTHIIFK